MRGVPHLVCDRTMQIRAFGLALLMACGAALLPAADPYFLYTGTYTDKGSEGIYAWRVDGASGKSAPLGLVAASANPTFLALHPNQKVLYAVNETSDFEGQKSGSVSAYAVDRVSGKLKLLNRVSSHGAGPCHVAVDATGKLLAVANYGGGNFATYPLEADGSIGKAFHVISSQGSGPNTARQEGPHGHSVNFAPDNRHMLATDLGTDSVLVSAFDAAAGSLVPGVPPRVAVRPGSGPRHLVFSRDGKYCYVINELDSTIDAYQYDAETGNLTAMQHVSTLPAGFSGQSTAAEIALHPSGKFLYGSNRGHDSIAVFAIDEHNGQLSPVEIVATGGRTPRNFTLDQKGRWLFAANQDSDNITMFRINSKTGKLTPFHSSLTVKNPVCVLLMPAEAK